MRTDRMIGNERGIALVVVLLVVLAVAAIIAGAALLGSSSSLITKNEARLSVLETVADAGVEEARSAINGNKALYPDSGFNTLEAGVAVTTSSGATIPGVKRWTYVGPSGVTTGQYGVFGSIVSVAQDAQGNRSIRRGEVYQDPFSKYAYFTTIEGAIVFANGDQIFGPVFSDDIINIVSSGATFWGPVGTAKTISGIPYGTFKQGYKQNLPVIPMPTTADLAKLKAQATYGGTAITGTMLGSSGQATTRIEFVALDLDNDGDSSDADEGFMKIYQVTTAARAWYVVADTNAYSGTGNTAGVRNSANCGHIYDSTGSNHIGQGFVPFSRHPTTWSTGNDSKSNAPAHGSLIRCYLGGSDSLNNPKVFTPVDTIGQWLAWPGVVDPRVTAKVGAQAQYLWPITRAENPNFRGVVYVEGKVAVSGQLRGQLTLAASGKILVVGDLTYVTNPAVGSCADILGMFSGDSVLVADNLLNDPIPYYQSAPGPTHWDATPDVWINSFVLALNSFGAESYSTGSTNATPCSGVNSGRGCLYLTGGLIQKQRGAVGLTSGQGYIKRYQYDACGLSDPPPYFPTTGHFARGHYFEVEPTGFNINSYWSLLVPH